MKKENEDKIVDGIASALVPKPGYVFTQCLMFFLHYGLKYTMPWWATWFPTIMFIGILVVLIIIFLFTIVVAAFTD